MNSEMQQARPTVGPDSRVWLPVRRAVEGEAEAIAGLINTACAHDADFGVATRTNLGEVRDLLDRGDFLVIDDHQSERLVAAMFVARNDRRGELALLAVDPEVDDSGLPDRLIAIAEALCEADGCTAIDLSVANLRTELPPWYRSLGYRDVGTVPLRTVPAPRRPCHLIRMTKDLH